MPMYYDFSHTRRRRVLAGAHADLAVEFLEALRRQRYSEREYYPDVNELAEDDLTPSVIATWAIIRDRVKEMTVHLYFRHRHESMVDHGDGEGRHGHMVPALWMLAQTFPEKFTGDARELERARRDLEGLIGLRSAAARGKFDPKQVFNGGKENAD